MAQRAHDSPDDPVLVLVEDGELAGTFQDWLALVASDGPTEDNVRAAETLRELREHGES